MIESTDQLRRLLGSIARTQEHELDCGEIFAVLDQHADAILAGEDVSAGFALMVQHLDCCPDCLEEYDALMSVLQSKL